ncbi:MAG: hypothetical protein KGJ86_20305 [Chloroflexota bacterium]|nr:hypothetical protein [Chloroflexota bacterium]
MNRLHAEYRDKGFEFLTIYVREPHPGEHYHEHRSWDEKVRYARDCREQDGIQNPLLVDDLEGTVHRAYGELPNMVFVVAKDGRVVYKAMWTNHDEIRAVLENLVLLDEMTAQGKRLRPSYAEKIDFVQAEYAGGVREKVFARAGGKAWADYRAAFGGR